MYREQVVFKSPFHSSTFRSKSFTAFEDHSRANYFQLLGLPYEKSSRGKLFIKGDDKIKIDVQLSPPLDIVVDDHVPIIGIKSTEDAMRGEVSKIKTLPTSSQSQMGGSLQIRDVDGQSLMTDPKTGELRRKTDQESSCGKPGGSFPLALGWPPDTRRRRQISGGGKLIDDRSGSSLEKLPLEAQNKRKIT